ncbi:MAG: hypothetical protein GY870_11935 [archaeon]|nr:hypothetical protein [archaeon]
MANTIEIKENSLLNTLKKGTKYQVKCPICKESQKIGTELGYLRGVKDFPFAHIHLHGEPIHALIVYIDKQLAIRGTEGCDSIEINKDSKTFQQILKKWSNPF